MNKEYVQPPRGVKDIIGIDAEIHEYLVEEFREVARLNGYKPVIPPTIEYSKLFEAKSGPEIKRSMYVFEDKAGRLLALRPEVTASIVRIYLRKLRGEPKPIRLYYVAQCFRYEEPQFARYREFWQAGLEIIGDQSVNSDLAVAYTASYYLDRIGIRHKYVVGNVAFYRVFMDNAKVPNEIQDEILHIIDKGETDKALAKLRRIVSSNFLDIIGSLLNTSLNDIEELILDSRGMLGEDSIKKLLNEYRRTLVFIDSLRELGYTVEYNPMLVRGLAYYTGLIYEYKSDKLKQSIGGGGRYDGLTSIYGGPYEYSTGLALGIDRIALALTEDKTIGINSTREVLVIIRNAPLVNGYNLLRRLNKLGIPAWVIETNSIKKALRLANKRNVAVAVIIGSREAKQGTVTVKNMESGEQRVVGEDEAPDLIKHIISKGPLSEPS